MLLVSTVPSTLWAFFRRLPAFARNRQIDVAVAAAGGRELGYFRDQLGTRTHTVNLTRRISPVADLRAVLALARIIRRNRYHIVHAHTPKAGLVGMLAAWLAGARGRIYTIHGLPAETAVGLTRLLLLLSDRAAARAANVVLVVSPSLAEQVRSKRVAAEPKLRMLGDGTACGIDVRRFTPSDDTRRQGVRKREELGIPSDARVLGFVGRLVRDKGVDVIVDVFGLLRVHRPELHLLLLGDYEPDRGRVPERTVERIENDPRIKHVSFDWDPAPYYAAMDVLLLATLREGFGQVVLEAASMEIPTVATRATGCVDAIVDGETGFLVGIGDVDAMARAAGALLDDEALRRRIGRAARERALRLFADERLLEEHVRLYQTMLNPTGP